MRDVEQREVVPRRMRAVGELRTLRSLEHVGPNHWLNARFCEAFAHGASRRVEAWRAPMCLREESQRILLRRRWVRELKPTIPSERPRPGCFFESKAGACLACLKTRQSRQAPLIYDLSSSLKKTRMYTAPPAVSLTALDQNPPLF